MEIIRGYLDQAGFSEEVSVLGFEEAAPITHKVRIVVGTVHSTKGMEFRACHFFESNRIKSFPSQRNMAFTACTRAKTSLTVYHSSPLPGYFDNALESLKPPRSKPGLDGLFNKER